MAPTDSMSQAMSHASPTSILLNIGHAMDHWILVVFAYSWGVIAGVWGVEWTELTPFNYGALFMFGAGSIVSGRLGDHWGDRKSTRLNSSHANISYAVFC